MAGPRFSNLFFRILLRDDCTDRKRANLVRRECDTRVTGVVPLAVPPAGGNGDGPEQVDKALTASATATQDLLPRRAEGRERGSRVRGYSEGRGIEQGDNLVS